MNRKQRVVLTNDQRCRLQLLVSQATAAPRTLTRAQILLLADAAMADGAIATAVSVSLGTVKRIRQRFAEEGVNTAIEDRQQSAFRRNLSANGTSTIVAQGTTRGSTPERVWTLKLVEDKFVEFTVGNRRDQAHLPRLTAEAGERWRPLVWRVPARSPTFAWRMEDVLALYAEPYNPRRPLVCFDERPYHLIAHTPEATAEPSATGAPFEGRYRRAGTGYLFMMFQPQRAWRQVAVMERRSAVEVAHCLQALVDVYFPEAECLQIVAGNVTTYTPAVLYETLPAAEAQRIAARLEWHYTPTQGNWLNMAQIELSLLKQEALDRPISDIQALQAAVTVVVAQRNREQAEIAWQLTTRQAREALDHVYGR